jgi:hypothetical protein
MHRRCIESFAHIVEERGAEDWVCGGLAHGFVPVCSCVLDIEITGNSGLGNPGTVVSSRIFLTTSSTCGSRSS